jgi:hypothetical protein
VTDERVLQPAGKQQQIPRMTMRIVRDMTLLD